VRCGRRNKKSLVPLEKIRESNKRDNMKEKFIFLVVVAGWNGSNNSF